MSVPEPEAPHARADQSWVGEQLAWAQIYCICMIRGNRNIQHCMWIFSVRIFQKGVVLSDDVWYSIKTLVTLDVNDIFHTSLVKLSNKSEKWCRLSAPTCNQCHPALIAFGAVLVVDMTSLAPTSPIHDKPPFSPTYRQLAPILPHVMFLVRLPYCI